MPNNSILASNAFTVRVSKVSFLGGGEGGVTRDCPLRERILENV